MGWLGRRTKPPEDAASVPSNVAERITRLGRFKGVTGEQVELTDRETIQRWLHEFRPGSDATIIVHRPWGSIAAEVGRRPPVHVFLADAQDDAWFAAAPGAPSNQELTPDQVAHIILDALTSSARPSWPEWHPF